jgi:hypothetical protein
MSLVVEADIAANPSHIALFRAIGTMLQPDSLSDLIEQLLGTRFHGRRKGQVEWFLCTK